MPEKHNFSRVIPPTPASGYIDYVADCRYVVLHEGALLSKGYDGKKNRAELHERALILYLHAELREFPIDFTQELQVGHGAPPVPKVYNLELGKKSSSLS
jgi:hypothetical protein